MSLMSGCNKCVYVCVALCVFCVYLLHSSLTSHPWQRAGDGQAWFGTWSALGLNWSVRVPFFPISLFRHVIPVCLITQKPFFSFKCSPIWFSLHVPIAHQYCELYTPRASVCVPPVALFLIVKIADQLRVKIHSPCLLFNCDYLFMFWLCICFLFL